MTGTRDSQSRFVLASRSPRRKELLELLVPREEIEVVPPRDANEAGFAGLSGQAAIERRVAEIAKAKAADVLEQIAAAPTGFKPVRNHVVIAADTVIAVEDATNAWRVLGQPPDDDTWPGVVRDWFVRYYAGRTHLAVTGVCVTHGDRQLERLVRTSVTFTAEVQRHLEWYLGTGEPRGKAGGYAIQGAGSVFVTDVSGSLSNVVGLPLEALIEVFGELGVVTLTFNGYK